MEYNSDLREYTDQLKKAQHELNELKQLPNGEQQQSKIKQVEKLQRKIQLMEGVIRTANKSKEILQQSAGVSDPAGVCLLSQCFTGSNLHVDSALR